MARLLRELLSSWSLSWTLYKRESCWKAGMLLIDTKQVLNSGQLPEHALLVVWARQCRATTGSAVLD